MPVLSWPQVAAAAILGGWTGGDVVIATSITQPESSRDDTIIQQGQPYATTGWGLWQITPGNSEPQFGINNAMLNPVNNAKAGHAKFTSQGWGAWTTWQNGLNTQWIPDAQSGYDAVRGMSTAQLVKLLGSGGVGVGGGGPTSIPKDLDWSAKVHESGTSVSAAVGTLVTYGVSVSGIKPKFTPPKVTVPDPATLLWKPGGKLPK